MLYHGDCRDVIKTLPDCTWDSVVTDPPYHLTNKSGGPHGKGDETPFSRSQAGARASGFMNKKWDGGDVAFDPETWREVLRVLKPGAYLVAFGGSRTYHRLACAIEDAGFEIRDQIMWVYGSGFPKSKNLDGEMRGWGTALKPAHEPDEAGSTFRGDAGSAARFFYCAKASRADRNEGIGGSSAPAVDTNATMRERENADWAARNGNFHPTVKPTDLMRYLCRLITPPGGKILDLFVGSGSTGKAAVLDGFQFDGIEREVEYIEIAAARIEAAQRQYDDANRQTTLALDVA